MAGRPESPPDRQSANDPEIDWNVAMATEILLDGKVADRVISYDCDRGEIVRAKRDRDDNIVVDLETGDAVLETLTGTVTVRWKDGQ